MFAFGLAGTLLIGLPILRLIKPETIVSVPILLGLSLYQFILKFRNCYTSYFSCTNRIWYVRSFAISAIICILLSSALSGTYQSAVLAKNMVEYDSIYLIDSLSATYTIKIMADYACTLREKGYTAHEIIQAVENLKSRVKVLAALDTLEYLGRGGRISKTAAAIGDLANIKPIITIN